MSGSGARQFWDEKARENALYFVDNEVGYDDPDVEAFWRRGEEVVERLFALVELEPRPTDRVVDIGCGVGRLTRALAARVAHVHGLDVSGEMLDRARQHNGDLANVEWLQGDGRGLGALADASVDGCFSHVVFQHIPDPEITLAYVRDMGRVLRDGGWALFQVSTEPRVHRRGGRLFEWLRRRPGGRDRWWWGSAVTSEAVRRAATEGELEVERILDDGSQFTTVLARRRPRSAPTPP